MKQTLSVLVVAVVFAGLTQAADTPIGGRVTTQQVVGGRQTDGGALPMSLTASGHVNTVVNGTVTAAPPLCTSLVQKVTSVGVADGGVTVPASPAASRRELVVCVSAENAGFPKVKCQVDPLDGKPVMGLTELGDVLQVGAAVCVTYPIDSTHTVRCIADTASTAVTSLECVP